MISFKSNVVFSQRVDNQHKKTIFIFNWNIWRHYDFLYETSLIYIFTLFLYCQNKKKRATSEVKEWEKSH